MIREYESDGTGWNASPIGVVAAVTERVGQPTFSFAYQRGAAW